MGRIWDPVDYTIFKVLTLQLKGFWFQWENPTLPYTGCSGAQPSPICNDSLLQQGGCHTAWPTLKELLGGLSEKMHEVLLVYTSILIGYLNP